MRTILTAALLVASSVVSGATAQDGVPAKQLFGNVLGPAEMEARSIGFYSRGCLAGANALPVNGPEWQVMRLSRNRYWGMPQLVDYIERLARDSKQKDGWPGLLVGDLSQPRGGPMLSGHSSHQVGLDVDIWFDPMPDRELSVEERENLSARSYIKKGTNTTLDKSMWTDAHSRLIRRAASYPEVDRIFVNAGVKKELCQWAGRRDRDWLRKVRPWYLHDDHLHVRLKCPPGMSGCRSQEPPDKGDGCGKNLSWWLSSIPYAPPGKPPKPSKPKPAVTLAGLPDACRTVLGATASGGVVEVLVPTPRARPRVN